MSDLWEKLSAWLIAGIMSLVATWFAFFRKRSKEDLEMLQAQYTKLSDKVNANKSWLMDHDKIVEVHKVHINRIYQDLESIKESTSQIHRRIDETNKTLHDKLDRLIERR